MKKSPKKLSKVKAKYDESDYHQAMDFALVLITAYVLPMKTCRLSKEPQIKAALGKVVDEMAAVYTLLGLQWDEYEKSKN